MMGRKWIARALFVWFGCLAMCSFAAAGEVEITSIKPVFAAATPQAGKFGVRVGLKNQTDKPQQVNLACLYLGLTQPGTYFKNEPQVQKQYQLVQLKPGQQLEVMLKNRFSAWHPETAGELVVTLVGANVVRSQSVATRFRPGGLE
ncbi:MAG: hypothetical protein H6R04_939 [Burkholderiaceae bacterium]|nr:hypothetical protein [Burkholderiaceae bacterium]